MSQPALSQPAFADTSEFYRVDAVLKLDPRRRSDLGQYMTPAPIARFMASLFSDVSGDIRLLDPGAGVGSLTAAFVERISSAPEKPRSVVFVAYEIEPVLASYLRNTLDESVAQCRHVQITARSAPTRTTSSSGTNGERSQTSSTVRATTRAASRMS